MSSNARLSLNGQAFVEETSEFVTVLGYLHVQTKALADGSVELQANVADHVLAYSADVQNPTTARRQRLLALRQQAVELINQIEGLERELGELRRELEQVLAAMRAGLEDIGEEEAREPLYSLAGVQRSLITCAPAIPCSPTCSIPWLMPHKEAQAWQST